MEPARVSSPQVDLTRCGLDKTPTLLVLQCQGLTCFAEGEETKSLVRDKGTEPTADFSATVAFLSLSGGEEGG